MPAGEQSSSSSWTREDDKLFEKAIVKYRDDCPDRWEKVALEVPGKSVEEVKHHYEILIEDVNRIESGSVELPCYNSCSDGLDESIHSGTKSSSRSDQERRKGIAWTEDEHRLFLLGLEKYGKGDWRGISRNFVVTRTPTQVASHAQKYFIRLNSMNKNRRRSSIHDITSVNSGEVSAPQGPITGKTTANIGMYGIGQCIGGPAVGTPVNLPAPGHLAYGLGAPIPGSSMGMAAPMVRPQVISVGHESVTRSNKNWQHK